PIDGPGDQKFLDQAKHEFRVARMLDHPHLIKVYALEEVKDWLFRVRKVHLLIEYVNGKTLDACPRLRLPLLVQVLAGVADGLVHMHRRGVAHGDLKPNNILVGPGGAVKVIDYGLARIKGEAKDRLQGTPEYMAPETARHRMVNERSDIYNLGAALYRMVTFRLPPCVVSQEDGGLPLNEGMWRRLLKPVQEFTPGAPPALCQRREKGMACEPPRRRARVGEGRGALAHRAAQRVAAREDRLGAREWWGESANATRKTQNSRRGPGVRPPRPPQGPEGLSMAE